MSGLTQTGVQILDATKTVNPLSNWFFMSASCLLIVLVGWYLTDRVIEPRLKDVEIDGDLDDLDSVEGLTAQEKRGLTAGFVTLLVGLIVLTLVSLPMDSPMRSPETLKVTKENVASIKSAGVPEEVIAKTKSLEGKSFADQKALTDGLKSVLSATELEKYGAAYSTNVTKTPRELTSFTAPLMQSIVPLIFLLFILPAIAYGYTAKTVKSHRDIVEGMTKAMSSMGYYLVLAFFASLFIAAFAQSNIGVLLAIKGANFLKWMAMPGQFTVIGIILLTCLVNLVVGSASAKWALLAPIFVPMLMQLGISPELAQAGYRIGDSSTNIITPLMPYFPLVVVFAQKYVKSTGIGTLVSLMAALFGCLLIDVDCVPYGFLGFGDSIGTRRSL